MISRVDNRLESFHLEELMELLVAKTSEYVELMKYKDTNEPKLEALKVELDRLHEIIFRKKSID